MFFVISAPEYNKLQSNTTKVRVHLSSGIAEIFDKHIDLMGLVSNNLVEIETNFENKLEKALFVLQDAVFVVSNKGLDAEEEAKNKGTTVYIYAKDAREITPTISLDEISKQYLAKTAELDAENLKLAAANPSDKLISPQGVVLKEKEKKKPTSARSLSLKGDVAFLEKVIAVIKVTKK
jgi:hypothetical protein